MVRYTKGFVIMDELFVRVFQYTMSDLMFYINRGSRLWLLRVVVATDRCALNPDCQQPSNNSELTNRMDVG